MLVRKYHGKCREYQGKELPGDECVRKLPKYE